MSGDRIVPLPGCAHVFPLLSEIAEVPPVLGACLHCGEPYTPLVLLCADCGKRLPPDAHECQTPRCMEQTAAFTAELIANYPDTFGGERR